MGDNLYETGIHDIVASFKNSKNDGSDHYSLNLPSTCSVPDAVPRASQELAQGHGGYL